MAYIHNTDKFYGDNRIMIIRKYNPEDCPELIKLFRETVCTVNAKDYSPEQLDTWLSGGKNQEDWNKSLSEHYTIVAEENIIIGFGDIDSSGYLDRLFVHKDFQRKKIATAICDALEKSASSGKITTHASITAKPFFLNRGYHVIKEQQVFRNGVYLINYVMEKSI